MKEKPKFYPHQNDNPVLAIRCWKAPHREYRVENQQDINEFVGINEIQ